LEEKESGEMETMAIDFKKLPIGLYLIGSCSITHASHPNPIKLLFINPKKKGCWAPQERSVRSTHLKCHKTVRGATAPL